MMTYTELIILCLCAPVIFTAELPQFLQVCHRNDPMLEQCLMKSVEYLRPYLIKGVPEFNIPSLEPLFMGDLVSDETGGVKLSIYNVSAYGCSDFFVRKIEFDNNFGYVLHVDMPKLRIHAHYSVDGKMFMIPVKGSGQMEINATECISTSTLKGELYQKNGNKYLHFPYNKLEVKIGSARVHLENFFNSNGDKIFLGIINDIVNRNLDFFLKDLLPSIEHSLSETFLEIGNDIMSPFTYDQLFPE